MSPNNGPTARAEIDRLERAAARLSPLERQVLFLSAGLGLGNDQIAARLGLGERRAERILAAALRKFDRALRPRDDRWWKFW